MASRKQHALAKPAGLVHNRDDFIEFKTDTDNVYAAADKNFSNSDRI